jgi:N-methylhydantoinase B/oxoprolinase/acetone carboxylase alpha subunit
MNIEQRTKVQAETIAMLQAENRTLITALKDTEATLSAAEKKLKKILKHIKEVENDTN